MRESWDLRYQSLRGRSHAAMLAADKAQDVVVGRVDRPHAVMMDHVVPTRQPCRMRVSIGSEEVERCDAVRMHANAGATAHVVDVVLPAHDAAAGGLGHGHRPTARSSSDRRPALEETRITKSLCEEQEMSREIRAIDSTSCR